MIQNKVMGVPAVENSTKRKNSEKIQICISACGRVYCMPKTKQNKTD